MRQMLLAADLPADIFGGAETVPSARGAMASAAHGSSPGPAAEAAEAGTAADTASLATAAPTVMI
jgi:hypothetical protein